MCTSMKVVVVVVVISRGVVVLSSVVARGFALFGSTRIAQIRTHKKNAFQNVVINGSSKT